MQTSLLAYLADPTHHRPLTLAAIPPSGGYGLAAGAPNPPSDRGGTFSNLPGIEVGTLIAEDGTAYPIRKGIPRFVRTEDADQLQTQAAFAFKWAKRDTYDSPGTKRVALDWYLAKYGFADLDAWAGFFDSRQAILDVGCGSGFSSSLFLDSPRWTGRAVWVGADISNAVDVAGERLAHRPNTHFVQADALQLPFADGAFDTVYSEGVLHHTPSTRAAILAATRVLAPGGQFHFYVYRRKGPLREFTDDYVRQAIAPLSDADAWEEMRSLTQLAKALAELETEVTVPTDVPLLGIQAGRVNVQRLIYNHMAKLFWNDQMSFEENVHVNFDWYRPRFAHRQTAEEVRAWCTETGLVVERLCEDESGISVRAKRT